MILRVLFHEPNPLKLWAKWDKAFSSSLWRVEALRTVDRLRLSGNLLDGEVADLASDLRIVHETSRSATQSYSEQANPFPQLWGLLTRFICPRLSL